MPEKISWNVMTKYTDGDPSPIIETEVARRKINRITAEYLARFKEDIATKKFALEIVTTCECCDGNDLARVSLIDRFSLDFGNLMCTNCGLLMTSPRMKESDLPYYYSEFYHPINYGKETLENQPQLFAAGQGSKIFGIVKEYLPNAPLSVLEIGSGLGDVITEFVRSAGDREIRLAVGTEFSDKCISVSESRAQLNDFDVQFIKGGFTEALALGKKFDVIILSHVFEHCIDLESTLHVVQSLLSSAGILYIEVPGVFATHLRGYYNYSFVDYTVHAHMYNFCAQTLENIVTRAGFECISVNETVEAVFRPADKTIPNIVNVSDATLFYLKLIGADVYSAFHNDREARIGEASQDKQVALNDLKTCNDEITKLKAEIDEITKLKAEIEADILAITEVAEVQRRQFSELTALVSKVRDFSVKKHPLKKLQSYRELVSFNPSKPNSR
jgi:ubiquinone/menaquinone biosynthesis C-methylase UbiE